MRIALFTDEINPERPDRALSLAKAWGVTHVEVRLIAGRRFPALPDPDLADFHARVVAAGLAVSGVSPGFFKCRWDDPSVGRTIADSLPRACEWARRMGTDLISCFAFRRDESGVVPPPVFDRLAQMADLVSRLGCRLALENEGVCWGDTGREAAEIVRRVGPERLGLCWDPGNAARSGSRRPYPDEYVGLKDLVRHVHMKNYDPAAKRWTLMDTGVVDWPGQLQALRADGYEGFLVVETHVREEAGAPPECDLSPLERNSLHNLRFVRSCLGRAG